MDFDWQDKLKTLSQIYKIPLMFVGIGSFLIIIAVIIYLRQVKNSSDIVFDIQSEATASAKIVIDIEGAVEKPGVYELANGSRIIDVLSISGGLSEEADRDWIAKNMNKAAKLTDGAKIFIPKIGDANKKSEGLSSTQVGTALGAGVVSGQVNVNTAAKGELEALNGIGPATAEKIIQARPFGSIDELKSRKILNNSTYEKLKDQLTVY